MFFSNMQTMIYDGVPVTDITKRISFINSVLDNKSFWFEYTLLQFETPEHIAHDYYGRSDYHWIILYANKCVDPIYDWFLSEQELASFITKKYGDGNENNTHHWLLDGIEYKTDPGQFATIVTNTEYETTLNDEKRTIKIIYPEYIPEIIEEYKKIIND